MGILFSWDVQKQERKKIKRRLLTAGGILLLILLLAAAYLWIYDGSKPAEFAPAINENRVQTELGRLHEVLGSHETEVPFRSGSTKALLVISGGETDAASLYEQNRAAVDAAETAYRRQTDAAEPAEILLSDWTYLPLWKSFFSGGLYASCYGKEAAKGKPGYRYMIELTLKKGNGQYLMRAFCSRPNDLDGLLTEFVTRVNSFAAGEQ